MLSLTVFTFVLHFLTVAKGGKPQRQLAEIVPSVKKAVTTYSRFLVMLCIFVVQYCNICLYIEYSIKLVKKSK